jgi:glutaredoxin 3
VEISVEKSTVSEKAKVKIFTTMICPYCIRAKMLLKKKGIPYEEIDVGGNAEMRSWLVQASGGRRTVPQIFIKGQAIGGFDELAALDRAGKLEALLT